MTFGFYETVPLLQDYVKRENPQSVLLIGGATSWYAKMIRYVLNGRDVLIDKVAVETQEPDFPSQTVYPLEKKHFIK